MKIRRIGSHEFIRCIVCDTEIVLFPKDLRKGKHYCANAYKLRCPVCKKWGLEWKKP